MYIYIYLSIDIDIYTLIRRISILISHSLFHIEKMSHNFYGLNSRDRNFSKVYLLPRPPSKSHQVHWFGHNLMDQPQQTLGICLGLEAGGRWLCYFSISQMENTQCGLTFSFSVSDKHTLCFRFCFRHMPGSCMCACVLLSLHVMWQHQYGIHNLLTPGLRNKA